MEYKEKWLKWAIELQSLSQSALAYCKDPFDIERFHRIREISAEMMAAHTDLPMEKVKDLFCGETGYQTPKLDCRAAVIREDKILLVQENSGLWALPGGWMDIGLTVGENTAKEAKEEAGVDVCPQRIIAVQDWAKRNHPGPAAHSICKIFVLCTLLGGEFQKNIETTARGWFSLDDLPALAEEKTNRDQIEMCFAAGAAQYWETIFD